MLSLETLLFLNLVTMLGAWILADYFNFILFLTWFVKLSNYSEGCYLIMAGVSKEKILVFT